MIKTLHIENFRGFERLDVEDLGRVNLIIGKNDSGKTSLMAAAMFSVSVASVAGFAPLLADNGLKVNDKDRVWRPLFRGVDTERGFTVSARDARGEERSTRVHSPTRMKSGVVAQFRLRTFAGVDVEGQILASDDDVELDHTANLQESETASWHRSYPASDADIALDLKSAYEAATFPKAVDIVKHMNPQVQDIKIVGSTLYVEMSGYKFPMPMTTLGEGSRRLLQIAMSIANNVPTIAIDEIENGFHHSALPLVWKLLREAPLETQIFATTHREENIAAAAQAFVDAKDDGLRIIRIDKTPMGHRAVSYTAERALLALEDGLEIRG